MVTLLVPLASFQLPRDEGISGFFSTSACTEPHGASAGYPPASIEIEHDGAGECVVCVYVPLLVVFVLAALEAHCCVRGLRFRVYGRLQAHRFVAPAACSAPGISAGGER